MTPIALIVAALIAASAASKPKKKTGGGDKKPSANIAWDQESGWMIPDGWWPLATVRLKGILDAMPPEQALVGVDPLAVSWTLLQGDGLGERLPPTPTPVSETGMANPDVIWQTVNPADWTYWQDEQALWLMEHVADHIEAALLREQQGMELVLIPTFGAGCPTGMDVYEDGSCYWAFMIDGTRWGINSTWPGVGTVVDKGVYMGMEYVITSARDGFTWLVAVGRQTRDLAGGGWEYIEGTNNIESHEPLVWFNTVDEARQDALGLLATYAEPAA